jgi:hypothetical protein
MRLLKKIALVLGIAPLLAFAGGGAVVSASAFDSSKSAACQGVSFSDGGGCGNTNTAANSLNKIVRLIINILSMIIGVAAVIMMMVAGFKFITSGGDASQVSSAKSGMLYAIVGLVVAALAQVLVRFVLNKV